MGILGPMAVYPSYLALASSGDLSQRSEALMQLLRECRLCCHICRIDRTKYERGFCKAPSRAVVSSHGPHHGEERPLSGRSGSGTIFFAHCNSRCCFCQNHDISQAGRGSAVSAQELAAIYIDLQRMGCHNLNLVSPTHFLPHIIEALRLAVEEGFSLPVVYNTNGFDSVEALRLLKGIVDIYLPDFKFGNAETAERLTGMKDYPRVCADAVAEMHRQTGPLETDAGGIARRGVIIRHLVLPDNLSNSATVFKSIAAIDPCIPVNIMAQYYPAFKAHQDDQLGRMITPTEYQQAVAAARKAGLRQILTL